MKKAAEPKPSRLLKSIRMQLLHDGQFLDQVGRTCILLDHEKHVANVHTDGTLHTWIEYEVTRHRFPVAVKCDTDQFAIAVDHW